MGGLLAGGVLLAAPAIVRTPGLLMPVKPVLRETRFWRLSQVYLAEEGNVIDLPPFAENVETLWQREKDSALRHSGEYLPPDRREILAKTYFEIPAGIDVPWMDDWNVEGRAVSRLSRL